MRGDRFKYIYSILLLLITVGWGAFCTWVTYKAATDKLTVDIVAATGAGVLLGGLLKMASDVNQYWFRKKLEETK